MNVRIFDEREQSICRNYRSQSQQESWLWSHVSTVYMDLMFMKALVESLLADGHYNLCNSDFAQWPVTPILKRVNKWNRIMSFSCKKVT